MESKKITALIENSIPKFITVEYPRFVEFLKVYYSQQELQGEPYQFLANLLDYGNVDETTLEYLEHFSDQYLSGLPYDTLAVIDKRNLIKHIKEFYESVGTEASVKFLFRILFNEEVSLYYPTVDILRVSDGKWQNDFIIKVSNSRQNTDITELEGTEIYGFTSGAKALVEKVKTYLATNGFYIAEIFLHEIDKTYPISNFQVNEYIIGTTFDGERFNEKIYSIINGYEIDAPGLLNQPGDIITITSNVGVDAFIIVDEVESGGIEDLEIIHGGDGYSAGEIITFSSPSGLKAKAKITEANEITFLKRNTLISSELSGNYYGSDCALSADGTILAVGARWNGNGKVFVYDRDEDSWIERSIITAADIETGDDFGFSCALSADGTILAVGAQAEDTGGSNAGKVYIYDWNGASWIERGTLIASDAAASNAYGSSCSLSADGTILAVGARWNGSAATNAGKVYIYDWNGASWIERGTLIASDAASGNYFGSGCALSTDGTILVVGSYGDDTAASGAGKVYIYDWNGASWIERGTLIPDNISSGDSFGSSCALSADGTILAVGASGDDSVASGAGKVYIYDWNGASWIERVTIIASDGETGDFFNKCALSADGLILGVGAMSAEHWRGKVYIYDWNEITDILSVKMINQGYDYKEIPEVNINSSGTGAVLYPISSTIGALKSLKFISFGVNYVDEDSISFQYEFSIDPGDITTTVNTYQVLYVYDVNFPFSIGDDVEGMTSGATGIVRRFGNNIIGITLDIDSPAFEEGELINTNQATIYKEYQSEVTLLYGAVGNYNGYFRNTDGFLDSNKYIQDSYYYQDFSYVINTTRDREAWLNPLKNTVHPAGSIVFGLTEADAEIFSVSESDTLSPLLNTTEFYKFRTDHYYNSIISPYYDYSLYELGWLDSLEYSVDPDGKSLNVLRKTNICLGSVFEIFIIPPISGP